METFSPVARMASFRLFVALCVLLGLDPLSCDVNTAYLNVLLKIIHFIRRIAENGVIAILLVYVDDLICATNDERWKVDFFKALDKYGIKDQGRLREYLGIHVEWTEEGAFLHQTKYVKDVLNRFGFGGARGCR
ncbi:hypothetical protein PR003_g1034 [Phytophthora rubi]|uniref:Reverse transcriptase Ty1/copia-type domain-containing protein n=1 Tax=Phytophthora rubi TaxID=129364 RepID=A0A6A4G8P5_9STRA|nr:hypothetical protein PR001_g1116 [Phytophthora rubi]KAE9358921.1 hypothetical protein PR003_g1034 [Phytophthora rubi]